MAKATHPAIIDTPPTGTTAPSQFQDGLAKVNTFSSPEKRMTPIRNAQAANRHALFGRCSSARPVSTMRDCVQHLIVNRGLKIAEPPRQIFTGKSVLCQQMVQAVGAISAEGDADRTEDGTESDPASSEGGHWR